jgi:SM-20-related protein
MREIDSHRVEPSISTQYRWAVLNGDLISSAPLTGEPYDFVFAKGAIKHEARSALTIDAPMITGTGSIPLAQLVYGPTFQALVDDLQSSAFRQIVERKFNLDLRRRPTIISVRGNLKRTLDGHVHKDLADKIITVILFLNEGWKDPGGRLRVLRSRRVEDYALEVPPEFGNILIFRRSKRSWHGHLPYEGPRLSIQFNWLWATGRSSRYGYHKLNFLNVLKRPLRGLIPG